MAENNLSARVKHYVATLLDIEQSNGIRAARKEYKNLFKHLPTEDGQALWKHIVDNKLLRFLHPARQPEYLIVYDEMWKKIIESYFLRKPGTAAEDEPDDILNGPVDGPASGKQAQALVKVLNERYPEQQRFKIRFVSADSIDSIMRDIRWVVDG
ncbi:MAG: hypothetical protein HZC05_02150 [Candidatus Magasanikbacteria bacterium]|nr:hypothetical protein [Candidatus Magasanikbacteria bacterium]